MTIETMNYSEFAAWATTQLVQALLRGQFESTLHLVLNTYSHWERIQDKKKVQEEKAKKRAEAKVKKKK